MRSGIVPPLANPALESFLGGLQRDAPVQTVIGAYTATSTDSTLLCSASAGAFTVTLPPASECRGLALQVKKTDASANAVTVAAYGSDAIEGVATRSLPSQYKFLSLVSDGVSTWYVFATT